MENKTSIKVWLDAFRLRTLPLSLSGIILGFAIAFSRGFSDLAVFGLALLTTVLFQIISNLANDLGDTLKGADNEGRVGPKRTVQSGAISIAQMKKAVALFSVLSLISALALIRVGTRGLDQSMQLFYVFLALFCILAAITYTMGKKAYGYLGLGDVFVFICFGLVSVMGVYPLFAKELSWEILLPATTIGFLSTAVLNLNNMRDRANDITVGKRTLVVKIGAQAAKKYHSFLILGAFVSLLAFCLYTASSPWVFLAFIPFIALFKHLVRVWNNQEERAYDPELKVVSMSTFFIAFLFTISCLITYIR